MFTKSAILLLASAAAVFAAPSGEYPPTSTDQPTQTTQPTHSATVPLTGVTHTIAAGLGGLRFEPNNVFAEVGDVVEWHFLQKEHGVVQSGPDTPCLAADGGFASGLQLVPEGDRQSGNVFQVVVEDKTPIWFYCPQLGGGGHCRSGMVGVINQKVDSKFTLAFHEDLARKFVGDAEQGEPVRGGLLIPNPNPLAGI